MSSSRRTVLNPRSLRSMGYHQNQLARSIAFGVSATLMAPLALAEDSVAAANATPTSAEIAPVAADVSAPAATPASDASTTDTTSSTTSATETVATPAGSSAAVTIDTLEVKERTIDTNPYAQAGAPYKARVSGDERHVRPLAETPQTISVLTQEQIKDSGRSDIKDIVAAQPGITLGTGENGNAFGDRYIIRGYEARSDVFVDGLRDPGMNLRESFASEQIELSKGPSATFAGRGTIGGAVNSISKQASTEYDFTNLEMGIGTDGYRRVTLDANSQVNDISALRVNLLQAYEEVPDRAPADRAREGFALAGLLTPTDDLELLADVYYINANDKPDLGTYIVPNGGAPVKDIPVYAQNEDFLSSETAVATLRVKYRIDDDLRLTNSLRYGTADNGYVATGARGTTRGTNDPFAGVPTVTLSSHNGWQVVENLANQLNLFWDKELFGQQHEFVVGLEYSNISVMNGVYTQLNNTANYNCMTGSSATNNAYCIVDGSGNYMPSGIESLMGRSPKKGAWDSDYNNETIALAFMDTVAITDKLDVFAGIRADSFDYSNTVPTRVQVTPLPAPYSTIPVEYAYSDVLFNFSVGVVYDITDEGNVYASFGTAAEINGGESDLGASCGYGGVCSINLGLPPNTYPTPAQVQQLQDAVKDSKPEATTSIELGTKWNLFDEKLLATAAIFQVSKRDVMEGVSAASYSTTGSLNTGANQVQGIELGLSGNLTSQLSTQFGVAVMEAEMTKSVVDPTSEGRTLSNFADNTLFLQLRYAPTDRFAFGGVINYASERYVGQPDSAASWNTTINDYSYEVPAYTTLDLFAEYRLNEKFEARLNVNNATDKDYYLAAYRSGAFTYIGDARNANLTLAWKF